MSNSLVLTPILDIQHAYLTMGGNYEGDLREYEWCSCLLEVRNLVGI
jgi:hypothetical protein